MTSNTREIALVGWALTWLVHSSWRFKRDPLIPTWKEKHRKRIVQCDVPLREMEGYFFQILVPVVSVEGNVWGGKCNGCCYSHLIVQNKKLLDVGPSWDEWLECNGMWVGEHRVLLYLAVQAAKQQNWGTYSSELKDGRALCALCYPVSKEFNFKRHIITYFMSQQKFFFLNDRSC